MSLKAACEFVVHLEGFRNVDLYHQGLYHIRLTIYHEENGVVNHPSSLNITSHPVENTSSSLQCQRRRKAIQYYQKEAEKLDSFTYTGRVKRFLHQDLCHQILRGRDRVK